MLERVRDFLSGLKRTGRDTVDGQRGESRMLLSTAHLFDLFHRYVDRFDELILQQISAGDEACAVPFAGEALDALRSRGFPRDEALKSFAMFYQLRRAYYFVAGSLVGRCPSMRRLRLALWQNVFTHDIVLYSRHLWNRMEDFSTLLLGETGTGKGAAAVAIGRSGFIPFDEKQNCFAESFMKSFVAINLSQFPEQLIESELFGHRKGAFTGAVESHEGVLARCSPHGSIFLDEIGDVSIPVQTKLLQVLQERVFTPVGSHGARRFHGRVIAATNKPLDDLRRRGQFRDDFFYRLCSDVIEVPPLRFRLREEPDELAELVSTTLNRIAGAPAAELTGFVTRIVERDLGPDYPWPGNVRELEQCVRRILLSQRYEALAPRAAAQSIEDRLAAGVKAGDYTAADLLADYCRLLHGRHGTYEEVARRTGLDRRTAKKYILSGADAPV